MATRPAVGSGQIGTDVQLAYPSLHSLRHHRPETTEPHPSRKCITSVPCPHDAPSNVRTNRNHNVKASSFPVWCLKVSMVPAL